jgi:predicted 2-oxoglutarate/Fe(II)-dependent dioxygenase YbiX
MVRITKRGFALTEESVEELLDCCRDVAKTDALIKTAGSHSRGVRIPDYRKTHRVAINQNMIPDTMNELEEWLGMPELEVAQIDLLEYVKGDHFSLHKDTFSGKKELLELNPKLKDLSKQTHLYDREVSTSTLIYTSNNLEGGELYLFEDKERNGSQVIDLKVGETVAFPSNTFHEVTKVTEGRRVSLVVWFRKRLTHSV